MDDKKKICCICRKEYQGYGNNPAPVSTKPDDRCCDECNIKVVFPTRLGMFINKED